MSAITKITLPNGAAVTLSDWTEAPLYSSTTVELPMGYWSNWDMDPIEAAVYAEKERERTKREKRSQEKALLRQRAREQHRSAVRRGGVR